MKNPTIATILNIIPGLGYIYIGGTKRIFGILLLTTLVLAVAAMFDPLLAVSPDDPYLNAGFRVWDILSFLCFILPIAAFMYDAYHSALLNNSKYKTTKS
ncbi:MAG TPA: hypothetical protein VF575_01105 [Candidatus Saccharimonadales bacterium]|jgi:hypothetical protein